MTAQRNTHRTQQNAETAVGAWTRYRERPGDRNDLGYAPSHQGSPASCNSGQDRAEGEMGKEGEKAQITGEGCSLLVGS